MTGPGVKMRQFRMVGRSRNVLTGKTGVIEVIKRYPNGAIGLWKISHLTKTGKVSKKSSQGVWYDWRPRYSLGWFPEGADLVWLPENENPRA